MNKQQQMQEILRDTIEYYREDPEGRRAIDSSGDCEYTTIQGRHCAVGRYMRPEFLDVGWEENNGVGVNGLSSYVDYYLKHEVRGLDMDFWRDLQDIHDSYLNWEMHDAMIVKHGFTDRGKERYVYMQDRIARGVYDD